MNPQYMGIRRTKGLLSVLKLCENSENIFSGFLEMDSFHGCFYFCPFGLHRLSSFPGKVLVEVYIYQYTKFLETKNAKKNTRPEFEGQLLALQSLQELSDWVSNLEEWILVKYYLSFGQNL